jgi:hypothetical protein
MSSEISLQTLVEGSDRINQMTHEIDWIVKTIFGFIGKDDIPKPRNPGDLVFEFTSHGYLWRITKSTGSLTCVIYDAASHKPGPWYNNRIIASPGMYVSNQGDPPLYAVIPIYSGIQQFIDKMIETFPQLKDRLAPLIAAAEWK